MNGNHKKSISLDDFKIRLNTPKELIKKNLDVQYRYKTIEKEMMDKAYAALSDQIQEWEPDAPRAYVEMFARVFFEIELHPENMIYAGKSITSRPFQDGRNSTK